MTLATNHGNRISRNSDFPCWLHREFVSNLPTKLSVADNSCSRQKKWRASFGSGKLTHSNKSNPKPSKNIPNSIAEEATMLHHLHKHLFSHGIVLLTVCHKDRWIYYPDGRLQRQGSLRHSCCIEMRCHSTRVCPVPNSW